MTTVQIFASVAMCFMAILIIYTMFKSLPPEKERKQN